MICLSPMSSRSSTQTTTMLDRIAAARRRRAAAAIVNEARSLSRFGTDLVILEPELEDLRAMGSNPMARDRAEHVIATARETVSRALGRLSLASTLSAASAG